MKIAIVGATGLVGREMLKILAEKNLLNNNKIFLYASAKSEGKILQVDDNEFVVHELLPETVEKVDFALFSAGKNISKQYAKQFAKLGAIVIDNSSAFRRHKNVPLVVPEINFEDILDTTKIIANPNCSTICLALPLFAIEQLAQIERVVVSTYQAVSGAGNLGLLDLENNTNNKFAYKITDNLIPQIDKFLKNGYTFEEDKMIFELKKILHLKDLNITATAVRVPISNCHSESVNFTTHKALKTSTIQNAMIKQQGILLVDNPETNLYPMPKLANMTDDILVGRIRKDYSHKNAYNMFLCMNNLRKGAALNAVQIMEKIILTKK